MRALLNLNIHHLRNIEQAQIQLHPSCNLFIGPNGSGKTSLLEAIYLLSTGYSFRTREISPLVSFNHAALTIFAKTSLQESISIQKSLGTPTQVKLNGQPCFSRSDLAHFLPCQVFYQDIFHIIDAGPAARRLILDWGLFHVEQSYYNVWKNYRLVLKHRNALLKQQAPARQFQPWNIQLVALAEALHQMRAEYIQQLTEVFDKVLAQLTPISCALMYDKGWDRKESDKSLLIILEEQFSQDINRGYTHAGAHQADIQFLFTNGKAKSVLSRGQQKILLIALKLAQMVLLPQASLYLMDDIIAELDKEHIQRLLAYLQTLNGQCFITALDDTLLSFFKGSDFSWFNMEKICGNKVWRPENCFT